MPHRPDLSIIIPARDEADGLRRILPELRRAHPDAEIIVVDDGSTDGTDAVCKRHGATVIRHPYTMGNGAAVKTGARAARADVLVFMDGDGQHDPADVPRLLEKLREGYAMVIGARAARTHASRGKYLGNRLYNRLATLMTGFTIQDLTSGFRAVRAKPFRNFIYLLPNGFSYPTTITMAFFRCGHPVAYVPIEARPRKGKSNIRILQDGVRFLIIILKVGALFSPMRLFLPISIFLFVIGIGYYTYTYVNFGRFTNMSALLLISSLIIFLIGILSEQISSLHYRNSEERRRIGD